MTDETKSEDLDIAISAVRRQLEAIDREMAALRQRRTAAVQYLVAMTGETVEDLTPAVDSARSVQVAGGDIPAAGPAPSGRKLNKRIVEEAMKIVAHKGHPMTAPEIHMLHSQKDAIGTEALYRLIYNRVISGSLYSFAGAFWPVDKPIPEGWDIAMAKRQHEPGQGKARRGVNRPG